MAIPGLALIGFMEEDVALTYLEQHCVCEDSSPETLQVLYHEARSRVEGPATNVGCPDVRPIPGSYRGHLGYVCRNHRFRETFPGITHEHMKLVEIAPLLAHQFHVVLTHAGGPAPMALKDQLTLCLPTSVPLMRPRIGTDKGGVYAEADDLNFTIFPRLEDVTYDSRRALLLEYGSRAPWVQVVHTNGRYALLNGYHRAVRLLRAGICHIPCVLMEHPDFNAFQLNRDVSFEEPLLLSSNPPTCAHFHSPAAIPVNIRKITRRFRLSVAIEDRRE